MAKNFVQDGIVLNVAESAMVHPSHTDGFVNSGDPVVVGKLVGVALLDAAATTDSIPFDTHGVWDLSVVGNDGGASAVAIGDQLYIDGSTGVINKNNSKTPFGIALETVGSGLTAVINVLVGP